MTTMDIGKEVAALCKQGKNQVAIDRFYSPNIESVETCAMPGMEQIQKGIAKIKGKNQWWVDNHEIHSGTVEGPYPNGDRFILHFMTSRRNTQGNAWRWMKQVSIRFKTERSSRRNSSTRCKRRPVGHIDLGWRTA